MRMQIRLLTFDIPEGEHFSVLSEGGFAVHMKHFNVILLLAYHPEKAFSLVPPHPLTPSVRE